MMIAWVLDWELGVGTVVGTLGKVVGWAQRLVHCTWYIQGGQNTGAEGRSALGHQVLAPARKNIRLPQRTAPESVSVCLGRTQQWLRVRASACSPE